MSVPGKKKSKRSLAGAAFDMGIMAISLYNWFGDVVAILKHEARLAGKSLVALLGLALLALCLMASVWICVLGLLGGWMMSSLQWSLKETLFCILGLNFILMLIVSWIILRVKKNLLFRRTRRRISRRPL